MSELLVLAARALCGGLFVMAFALIGELVTPKQFAGIFSAAPAVALAGMTLTMTVQGDVPVAESALGMIAGSVALVAYCASAVPLVTRLGVLLGTIIALVTWGATAAVCRALIAGLA
ncbi:DUF3147 family protein [Microtetraspora niveoalba]|uniref:DUF3147 family protein n=1 Tax=Microtetraspora niveoalba TaxID=46175 RepID=UPI0008305128|nr:DUF3147 family protein [Microtetraspora niveoalba]